MTESEIRKYKTNITSLLKNARLYEAFAEFDKLLNTNPNWEISEDLSKLQMSYKYMLMYMAQGTADPQKEQIYNNILLSLYGLLDRYCHHLMLIYSHSQYYAIRQDFSKSNARIAIMLEQYNAECQKYQLYLDVPENNTDKKQLAELKHNVEKTETKLFNYIWTSYRPDTGELESLKNFLYKPDVSDEVKSLLISAIFLNLNNSYDENLLLLLFDLYLLYNNNDELAIRLMCCIFLLLHKYNDIAILSTPIKNHIQTLKDDSNFNDALELIILQFIKSCDTDKLTKMMQEEFLPGLMNASSGFMKNLKKQKIDLNDITEIESNPEWEEFLEKSGFANKIKELNEIQMDGGDVFLGTFSKLKTFPFFHDVSNWFVPFSTNHSAIMASSIADNKLIMNIISNARFLCDSDRFSFCLSIDSIPATQKEAMLTQFDAQNEMLDEIKQVETIDTKTPLKQIIANYMQDLYRFFNLYNRRTEFDNPFTGNILNTSILNYVILKSDNLILIGEYYLKRKYYNLALTFFLKEIEVADNYQPNIIQKIGFCYQNLKMYDKAITYYSKYDLFDNTNLWNIKHIAASFKAAGNIEKALEYYRKAESIASDNLSVCLNIGHCLLELNKVDDALKYYFKVNYLKPSDNKTLRPIAWCLFLQKKFIQSEEYYNKILTSSPTAEDYMNYGHLKLVQNNIKDAINAYAECVKLSGKDFSKFASDFNNDSKYLSANGIASHDMALILDIVHYNI